MSPTTEPAITSIDTTTPSSGSSVNADDGDDDVMTYGIVLIVSGTFAAFVLVGIFLFFCKSKKSTNHATAAGRGGGTGDEGAIPSINVNLYEL